MFYMLILELLCSMQSLGAACLSALVLFTGVVGNVTHLTLLDVNTGRTCACKQKYSNSEMKAFSFCSESCKKKKKKYPCS